jgi:phosphomannomutase
MKLSDWISQSGVSFGTSGARGLVTQMNDQMCFIYTQAFLKYMQSKGVSNKTLALAGDLRTSSPRIVVACASAALQMDWSVVWGGFVPSPAIAYFGQKNKICSIMVTGSHIPEDRNGIKFNSPDGEIDKLDEMGITNQFVEAHPELFDQLGFLLNSPTLKLCEDVENLYIRRYTDFFPEDLLKNLHIAFYEQSTVGRKVFPEILERLGAKVTRLGRADCFIPVDTEAVRIEDLELANKWCKDGNFDALFSADGDADRPLVFDQTGSWIRGDILGIIAARELGIKALAIPVSCNGSVDSIGVFDQVVRTRIGSPFVIKGMQDLASEYEVVAGYEANGGFLLQTNLIEKGNILEALPTRDALLPFLALLRNSLRLNLSLSSLRNEVELSFCSSQRLQNFATEKSKEILDKASGLDEISYWTSVWMDISGCEVKKIDKTDGLRFYFSDTFIIHLRPSGNAPEFRCYVEAPTSEQAENILRACLALMESWR